MQSSKNNEESSCWSYKHVQVQSPTVWRTSASGGTGSCAFPSSVPQFSFESMSIVGSLQLDSNGRPGLNKIICTFQASKNDTIYVRNRLSGLSCLCGGDKMLRFIQPPTSSYRVEASGPSQTCTGSFSKPCLSLWVILLNIESKLLMPKVPQV